MAVVTSAYGSTKDDHLTLLETFNNTKEMLLSIPETNAYKKYIKNINFDCLKEKLNLPENGGKSVTKLEGRIVVSSAYLKCFQEDEVELLNFLTIELGLNKDEELNTCTQLKLTKFDPTS